MRERCDERIWGGQDCALGTADLAPSLHLPCKSLPLVELLRRVVVPDRRHHEQNGQLCPLLLRPLLVLLLLGLALGLLSQALRPLLLRLAHRLRQVAGLALGAVHQGLGGRRGLLLLAYALLPNVDHVVPAHQSECGHDHGDVAVRVPADEVWPVRDVQVQLLVQACHPAALVEAAAPHRAWENLHVRASVMQVQRGSVWVELLLDAPHCRHEAPTLGLWHGVGRVVASHGDLPKLSLEPRTNAQELGVTRLQAERQQPAVQLLDQLTLVVRQLLGLQHPLRGGVEVLAALRACVCEDAARRHGKLHEPLGAGAATQWGRCDEDRIVCAIPRKVAQPCGIVGRLNA
mmetsp:Transcript_122608/g.341698  ORF Transcript_122608/g.341698 Transcript_122608/m.341698 type:complete len:346 (-) Transcript_122608:504-1541(-)